MTQSVIIIGGGVAGIAAGSALADAGMRVHLLEKRPLMGGRASSFIDHETGERLDACQHGTMRCCTNLTDLLERLGVADLIRYHSVIEFLDKDGRRSVIKGCGLPAPAHTALSFLAFRSLDLRDKIGIARGLLAMLTARMDDRWDAIDAASWFRHNRQTERAIRRFWEPILVSACNESLERIACTHAFKIFRDGFLSHAQAFHFGIPRVPLGTLYTEPTVRYIEQRGGCVRLRTLVDRLCVEDGAVQGVSLVDGTRLTADYYVAALQFDLLLKLLPEDVTRNTAYFENIRRLELSPIVGVHLWFDRKIHCPHALALLDRETDWIFNKSLNFDRSETGGTYLSVVISADRRLTQLAREEILERVLLEVRDCLPETRQARVVKWNVLKERKATFSPMPGMEKLRPDQRSPIAKLYVAGEWTRTGWPSTMEGATRSGYLAAEYVTAAAGAPRRFLAPDLRPGRLARWLMGRPLTALRV